MNDTDFIKMMAWCGEHRNDERIREWLRSNPPPPGWQGTDLEWAYTEMPQGLITGRPGRFL